MTGGRQAEWFAEAVGRFGWWMDVWLDLSLARARVAGCARIYALHFVGGGGGKWRAVY